VLRGKRDLALRCLPGDNTCTVIGIEEYIVYLMDLAASITYADSKIVFASCGVGGHKRHKADKKKSKHA
jgi:hypothetical protein